MTISKKQLMERAQWRSLAELSGEAESPEWSDGEFPEGAESVEMSGMSRRKFLGVMSASMALSGFAATGCIRKPVENILSYSDRPEDLVPGRPRYYRTVMQSGQGVLGLHVESQEGRPTKVEGSPDHPMNNPNGVLAVGGETPYGAANGWAQASVLDLYDPDRSTAVRRGEQEVSLAEFFAFLEQHASEWGTGEGMALLVDSRPSPTLRRVLADFARTFPQATIYEHDAIDERNVRHGATLVGADRRRLLYNLDSADVILTLDADILAGEGDAVRNAALFASRRSLSTEADSMNRLYAVEPALTVTGASADNRLRLSGGDVGAFVRALAGQILSREGALPGGFRERVQGDVDSERFAAWIEAVADDLIASRGRSLVVAGVRQPAWVHSLVHLINDTLGNVENTVVYVEERRRELEPIEALAAAIGDGQIRTLIALGPNPAVTAPSDLNFADLLGRVELMIHQGYFYDETAQLATWHLPSSHYLESWGDLVATDGTVSVQQPLIAPLYDTRTEIDILSRIVLARRRNFYGEQAQWLPLNRDLAYELVRDTTSQATSGDFEAAWRRWLHDGIVESVAPQTGRPNFNWDGMLAALDQVEHAEPSTTSLEVNFYPDYSVYDGRYANNGWLQEMPDPMTKLTWDNVAALSPKTAEDLGVESGDLVELSLGGRNVEIAAMAVPGTADNTVILSVGQGRSLGVVSEGAGFDTYQLRTTDAAFIGLGGRIQGTGREYELATTQHHHRMEPREGWAPRPLVRSASLEHYREEPEFVLADELIDPDHRENLFPTHEQVGQQWALSIDLTRCTGCSACVIACQAENSVPIVTKERVLQGREMHWLRIDRYYTGEDHNDPQAVTQPIPCQQCENAPCEPVCPVGATAHSPEGLNDMAYNRCIGTRYCSNNCPYKVRRFNYFNFNKENDKRSPMLSMQRNPDVTVRFRGVMEKCTYCVQRINQAKIANHREGSDHVPDGQIVPACVQTCPTRALVFGDKTDSESLVNQLRAQNRTYELLGELNNRPRTTYMAKIRNPNPALV